MWQVKEFEYDPNINDIGELLKEFMKEKGIEDFEVVGYNASWSEEYESFANHMLIKYWEDK